MIEHESTKTQAEINTYDSFTRDESSVGLASMNAFRAELDAREEDKISAANIILDPIRARLAAGTVSTARLQIVTGLESHKLKHILDGKVFGIWDYRDTKQALEDLAAWAAEDAHPAEDDNGYAVTPTFQLIQTLLDDAHRNCRLIAITGSWGIGKTQAAKYYAATHPRTHSRPGAIRVQFDSTDYKPVAVLEKIRDAMSANPGSHRRGNAINAIGNALRPGDFFIFEECQRLKEALEVICSLHDEFGVGIAMTGNPVFSSGVWGKRPDFGALANRAARFDFPATTPEDVEAWLAWYGFPEGMDSTGRKMLTKAAVNIAARPGQNGGLRTLAQLFDLAKNLHWDAPMSGDYLLLLASQYKPAPSFK